MNDNSKDDGGSGDNWSIKSSPPTNQHLVFTGQMPFLSPNQQCTSTEGNNVQNVIVESLSLF